jgi:hypothetical protein
MGSVDSVAGPSPDACTNNDHARRGNIVVILTRV